VPGFFLGFGRLHVVFHGVDVDIVGFNCFSTLMLQIVGERVAAATAAATTFFLCC